jgi:hypothetical protein
MNIKLELKEAIRFMLLPLPSEKEEEAIDAIIQILNDNNIEENSYIEYIRLKYNIWLQDYTLDATLKAIISRILIFSNPEFGTLFSEKYFEIHNGLLKNPFFTFELCAILLSHLRLITNLAVNEKMSAAKIARVLRSMDHRLYFMSWKDIQIMLHQLKIEPQLNQEQVAALYLEDESLEEEYFADADLNDALNQIGEVARKLQFSGDASNLLRILSRQNAVHLPYLQILHYQCLISGFYDHVLSTPYEFSPRGQIANWLFSKWNGLLHTSNPILNNAKAVDVLDENWARSRKPNEYEQAAVLVELLKGLDGMGFSASQELTSWIRRWLVRYIKLESITIVPLSLKLKDFQIKAILDYIKVTPTGTYGILEQRFIDVLAASLNRKEDGWRSRGLSDSVNSNNLSKRKLGDCDFQNSSDRIIIAYEAHGGRLSKIYFEGHIRTFRRALLRRREELESISDIDQWKFKVIFVAYGFEENLPNAFEVEGINVKVEFITLEQFYEQVDISTINFKSFFNTLFIDTLNNRRTPTAVREKVRTLIS